MGYVNSIKIKTRFDEQGSSAIVYLSDEPGGDEEAYFWLWLFFHGTPTLNERYEGLAMLSLVRDAFINNLKIKIYHSPTSYRIRTLQIIKPSTLGPAEDRYVTTAELRRGIEMESLPSFD